MKIGCDFDGVLCFHKHIPTEQIPISEFEVMPGAVEAISLIMSHGYEVYIFTNRTQEDWKEMQAWLYAKGFPGMRITNIKEKGTTIYIDDRAWRFTNWQDTRKLFI